jgi:type VI secretion system VgrG family protein
MNDLSAVWSRLQSQFKSDRRLYAIEGPHGLSECAVHVVHMRDGVNYGREYMVDLLHPNAYFPLDPWVLQPIKLWIALSDGTRVSRSGLITEVCDKDSDGGLARYRLTVHSWLWLLTQSMRSRVRVNETVLTLIERIFAPYRNYAAWRLAPGVETFLADLRPRIQWTQHRETDFDAFCRLLASEGLSFYIEEHPNAPYGQVVIFVDSHALPEDHVSEHVLGGRGIRFHGARAVEEQDAIQIFSVGRCAVDAHTTTLAWNYEARRSYAGSVPGYPAAAGPGHLTAAGPNAPRLENYVLPQRAYQSSAEAEHYTRLRREATEAAILRVSGRTTVRTLHSGTTFQLALQDAHIWKLNLTEPPRFAVLSVEHAGINNLPREIAQAVAREHLHPDDDLFDGVHDDLVQQAQATGYGNRFTALPAEVPWRPQPLRAPYPHPQTALVVGPNGETTPNGADELYMDRLGRVRLRFPWQRADSAPATAWVRVSQRYAGAGYGTQFIPRIGQEVLVNFLNEDLDQPIVVMPLFNGRGEGGEPRTPGGKPRQAEQDANKLYAQARDHRPSAQGNLAGGNSPAWHGASPLLSGHANAAALTGFKTKEFGGSGHNELAMDDTSRRLRVHLACSQARSALTLGHNIHQQDNYRGSYRGTGFEVRTDAYGAIRTARGLLITTFGTRSGEPSQDNAAGISLAKQAAAQAKTFSDASQTHQTVRFATVLGTHYVNASTLSDTEAPLPAMAQVVAGMVDAHNLDQALADAEQHNTATGPNKVPHSAAPVISVVGKAGIANIAAQDQQWAANETVSIQAGQDVNVAVGEQLKLHAGQAIGMLAGAIKAGGGAAGTGLTVVAAEGPINVQAQADAMQIAAKDDLKMVSVTSQIDFAAAKSIELCVAGGAAIIIDASGVRVTCSGIIAVHAGTKSFIGPDGIEYPLPRLPKSDSDPKPLKFNLVLRTSPGPEGTPLSCADWQILRVGCAARDRVVVQGRSNEQAKIELTPMQQLRLAVAAARWPNALQLWADGVQRPLDLYAEQADWSADKQSLHGLASLDFSDDPRINPATPESRTETQRAAGATGERANSNFFKKL